MIYLLKMELGIAKKRKSVMFQGVHTEIEKKLSLNPYYTIEIDNANYIKYILDNISTSNSGTKFVLVDDNNEHDLKVKDGYYSVDFESKIINVEILSDLIRINNTDLELLKRYLNFVNQEINRIRLIRDNIQYYIYYQNSWNFLDGSPKRSLNSVFIDSKVKKELLDNINTFMSEKELYLKLGIPYKYNVLFYGIPGTGKTSFISAIASEINYDIAIIPSKNLEINNDTELILALSKIPKNCILLIEDVENICKTINLTSILDGINVKQGLITFMTSNITNMNNILSINHRGPTNNPLIRPCRIDYNIEFTWAKKNEIINMYNRYYQSFNDNNSALEFYNKVRHFKLTISLLQEFFFKFRSVEELFLNINEFKIKSKKYYPNGDGYSSSYLS